MQNVFLLIAVIIIKLLFKNKKETIYSKGRKNTPHEQRVINRQMRKLLEENPELEFFEKHPEYKEAYLDKISLRELDIYPKE